MQLGEHAGTLEQLDLALEHIDRITHPRCECRGSVCFHKCIWIFSLRQRDHSYCNTLTQKLITRPKRCLQSWLVAVIEQKDVFRKLPQRPRLCVGERSSHWRHNSGDSGSHQAYDIEVAFDDEHMIFATNVILRPIESIKRTSLGEYR